MMTVYFVSKSDLKRKAFSGFQVCVGISCVRLTRDRFHTRSVRWPALQPASGGLGSNTKSFHITIISALPMTTGSHNPNPRSRCRNVMTQVQFSTSSPTNEL